MSVILVVDDEPDIQSTMQLILGLEGYRVLTAYDGEEGLQLAKTRRPDLIVTDIMMPRMDGIELCRALRAEAVTRDIPVIVSSSIEPQPQSERCWDLFVLKAGDVDDMLAAAKSLLEKGRRS